MKTEAKKKFLIDFLYILAIAAIVYVILKYVISVFMPFIIGFAIALVLRPLVEKLSKTLRIKRSIAATLILIVFYAVIGVAITIIVLRVSVNLSQIFQGLPRTFQQDIQPAINTIMISISDFLASIDPNILAGVEALQSNILDGLSSVVTAISSRALIILTNMITSIPAFLLTFLFTIISSFFFTIDFQKVILFVKNQLGGKTIEVVSAIKESFSSTIAKFFKAYLMLMTLTFVELSIGFFIIGLSNAMGVAFIIACIDILPVLGTGGVMIPWAIIELVNGNMQFGMSLLVIYIIVTVIRNIVEPKVVGDQIGLHPLLTLMAMYVGTSLFGIIGLFGLPIALTILNNLQERGIIQLYKKKNSK